MRYCPLQLNEVQHFLSSPFFGRQVLFFRKNFLQLLAKVIHQEHIAPVLLSFTIIVYKRIL